MPEIVFLLDLYELQNAIRAMPLEEVVADVLKGKWDHERTKFCLPPLMNLVYG